MTPRQSVPSESPMSPLSMANPSRRAGAACKPVDTKTPAKGCAQHHGLSPPLGDRAVPVAQGGHSFMGSVLRWYGWWKRSFVAGRRASLHPMTQPALQQRCLASRAQLRADRPASQAGRLSGQKAFYPSKYALNSMKLAPPYNYGVGKLY